MTCFSPVFSGGRECEVDLSEWREDLGKTGGFGTVWTHPTAPGFVLKRLHTDVPRSEHIRAKLAYAKHARLMIERLTEIINDEKTNGQRRFVIAMCTTLRDSVTTHVGYDASSQGLFLLQKLAPGKSLEEAFLEPEPEWAERLLIARNFAAAMVALRRCRVIHLDCRPVNVFVDRSDWNKKVTLIDLDGCGVLGSQEDTWHTPPGTLGNLAQELHPLWFPFDVEWQPPRRGNFYFAERWCVLNEVWRILSWSRMTALGWVLDECWDDLCSGFERVREMAQSQLTQNTDVDKRLEIWQNIRRAVAADLRAPMRKALEITETVDWGDFGLGDGSGGGFEFLRQLGFATVLGMVNTTWTPISAMNPELRDVPHAKWIQDQLISAMHEEHDMCDSLDEESSVW